MNFSSRFESKGGGLDSRSFLQVLIKPFLFGMDASGSHRNLEDEKAFLLLRHCYYKDVHNFTLFLHPEVKVKEEEELRKIYMRCWIGF
jgi:hypothetical protein